ncbi:MAG: ABC transporter permease [Chitinivibrionales bacterium]|nr:ABC transporter permease [Chitinivibrionales bacterium]
MNKINTYFELGWKSLTRQKSRTILTIIALSIGIALLIIMIAAGAGLKSMVMRELDIYSPNTIDIEVKIPGKQSASSTMDMAGGAQVTTFKNSDVEALRKIENVSDLYSFITGQQIFKYANQTKSTIIFGYGAEAPNIEKIDITSGRFYSKDEEDSLAQVTVIGPKLKDALFGDADAVGQNVYVKGLPFKIVGITKSRGSGGFFDYDSIAYIPVKTMQKKLMGTDYVVGVLAEVKDVSKINETKSEMEYLLRERHNITDPERDDFAATTMAEARVMVQTILNGITLLLVALTFISLLVGGVGITNIMYVSVIERTFEIGLRRAVGATKADVLGQFLSEAVILTTIGGVVGIVIGSGVAFLVYYIATSFGIAWSYSVSLVSVISALAFSAVLGLAFGVYPARQASNLDPIAALRRE